MTVLVGHPTGNPNSHHAALAHYEAGWLERFCVPWMPSEKTLAWLKFVSGGSEAVARLSRRGFGPLGGAPLRQGRIDEFRRLFLRTASKGDEGLAYQANDWLMRTMSSELQRSLANIVHSYEDCSLWQFEAAKKKGLRCVYDMPIGYYPVWQQTEAELMRKYGDWHPEISYRRYVRPEQKKKEMELADLVLAPSSFVDGTIKKYFPEKPVALAPYGVDADFWTPAEKRDRGGRLVFVYAGQISIRKGSPDLIQAWARARLKDAELHLIGSWQLADKVRRNLPSGITWYPACSAKQLREHYRRGDVFVFPSYFEGFGLVLLEAMACGLPAIATRASAMADVFTGTEGLLLSPGDVDGLVAALEWASDNRDQLRAMGNSARQTVERYTWSSYRKHVQNAVGPLL